MLWLDDLAVFHAYADRGCTRAEVFAGLESAVPLFSSLRIRSRRAIFFFRSRLNLDLSPFRADIVNSLWLTLRLDEPSMAPRDRACQRPREAPINRIRFWAR